MNEKEKANKWIGKWGIWNSEWGNIKWVYDEESEMKEKWLKMKQKLRDGKKLKVYYCENKWIKKIVREGKTMKKYPNNLIRNAWMTEKRRS